MNQYTKTSRKHNFLQLLLQISNHILLRFIQFCQFQQLRIALLNFIADL